MSATGVMLLICFLVFLRVQLICMQALDAAFAHYDADWQKRMAKSGLKPNGSI